MAGFSWKGKGVGTRKAATKELCEPGSAEKGGIRYLHVGGREFSAFKSQPAMINRTCETAAGPRRADEKQDDRVLEDGAGAPSTLLLAAASART